MQRVSGDDRDFPAFHGLVDDNTTHASTEFGVLPPGGCRGSRAGSSFSGLGAALPSRRGGPRQRRRGPSHRSLSRCRDRRLLRRRSSPARPARSTGTASTATNRCCPTRPRASSRTGRTVRRRSSIPPRSPGPTTDWHGRPRSRARSSTRCTSARSRRRARGRPPRRELPALADARHHRPRGDAGRRVPGRVRLGLRRRQPVRPDPPLRHARRLPRASSTPPTASASASSSTSSTTTSARTATTCAQFSDRLLHRQRTRPTGARRSTSTATAAGRCASSSSPTPRYWIDEFHLDGLRLDATQNIYDDSPHEHILAAITRARARGGRRPRDLSSSPRTSRRTRRWCGRAEQGGYGLDALWNDDFHHAAMVALTGRNEAYYTDYRGTPQEFVSRRQVRASSTRASATRGRSSARGTPALRPARRARFVDVPRRTTIRSPTPAAASACTS